MKKLIFTLAIATLALCAIPASGQSAWEQAQEMAGNVNISVPPASPPACVYCGHILSGPNAGHYPGCPYGPKQSSSSEQSSSREENYYNAGSSYDAPEPEHVIYVPPTPIRDTPEGQAMLAVAEELGYAMGSMLAEGLRDLISWGFDKIYDSTHKEYHGLGHGKQNRNYAVVAKKGKYGIWDNNRHRWSAKPAFSSITITCLDAAPAQDAKTGKWGIYNVKEKKAVVPFQFDECKYFPEGGPNDPVALGLKDAGGNMHWRLGAYSKYDDYGYPKLYGKPDFDFWDGEYASVDLTHNSRGDLALLVKEYNTGDCKLRGSNGKYLFWGTASGGRFDSIQLTGMTANRKDAAGNVIFYDDFYIVSQGGKKGYAVATSSPDHKHAIDAYQMLPCIYDEITPIYPMIPEGINPMISSSYDCKEYVLVRKDGMYGLGAAWDDDVEKTPYTSCVMTSAKDQKGKRHHYFVVGLQDGTYKALLPNGWDLYMSDGNHVVSGNTMADVVRVADVYFQNPQIQSRYLRKMINGE